jgi:FkbM family methyltransferase
MVETADNDYRDVRRFILCDLIWESGFVRTPLVVLDIGARDALSDTRWTGLPREMVRLHGFEPDDEECRILNERAKAGGYPFVFHSTALAETTGEATLYQYAEPAANSLYPGNARLLARWCYNRALTLTSQFRLSKKSVIPTKSLADWASQAALGDIDFCKLNVQGAELDILRGAGARLESVLGIVAEQTFNETYLGAPLFGEVYDFIRRAGFTMFDVLSMNLVGRTASPVHISEDHISARQGLWGRHQFFEGHFLYLRDPILSADQWSEEATLTFEQTLKVACLAEIFGQVEFAFELLAWLAASPRLEGFATRLQGIINVGSATYQRIWNPPKPPVAETVAVSSGETAENVPLQAALEACRAENSRLRTAVEAQTAEISSLESSVEAIRRSTSWRVTAPLRAIVLLARALFN